MSGFKRYRKGFSLAILTLGLTIAMIHTAMASPIAVAVDPLSIFDPAMVPGTQFSIDITVDYITRLQGYQFLMFFNPDVLHGVNVTNGPFLESAGATPIFYPGLGFNNTEGLLYLVVGMLPSGLPPTKYPIGGGVLATIWFEVVGAGISALTLGIQTGLINMTGGYDFNGEWCYGFYPVPQYPGGPIDWDPTHPLAVEWQNTLSAGSGNFDNRPFEAKVVRRSAWCAYRKGSGPQTLYAIVKNTGDTPDPVFVKVVFTIRNETGEIVGTPETETRSLLHGEITGLRNDRYSVEWMPPKPGKYSVEAGCLFGPDGELWAESVKSKSFSFSAKTGFALIVP